MVEQALRPALLTVVGLQWGCHSLVGLPKATSTGSLSSAVRLLTLDARAPSSRAASGRFGMLLARRLTDGAGLCPWVVGAGGRAAGGRRVCSAGRCSRILAELAGLNRQERLARDGWEEELTLAAPGRGQKRKTVTTHYSSSYAVCPSRAPAQLRAALQRSTLHVRSYMPRPAQHVRSWLPPSKGSADLHSLVGCQALLLLRRNYAFALSYCQAGPTLTLPK